MSALVAGAFVGLALMAWTAAPDSGARLGARPAAAVTLPPPVRAGSPSGPLSGRGRRRHVRLRRFVLRLGDRVRRSRRRRQRQDQVVDLCSTFSAELRAGRPVGAALRTAAPVLIVRPADPGEVAGAVGRLTGPDTAEADVPALLAVTATVDGWEGLSDLAAGWVLALGTGSPLSDVVDRIGDGLRARQQLDREVAVELAGPRATARLLMALPALGLALGRGVGADPLQVLLHTAFGRAALAAGCLLMALGWVWTTALARRAGRA